MKRPTYPIYLSSTILTLLGVWALVMNTPGVFVRDTDSIVREISAICIILAVGGILKMARGGLYFLAFSIVFPVVFFYFRNHDAYFTFTGITDLVIFIYLIFIYRACPCTCKDSVEQKKFYRISRLYLLYAAIIYGSFILAIIFGMLSCAEGSLQAGKIMKAIGLYGITSQFHESEATMISQYK